MFTLEVNGVADAYNRLSLMINQLGKKEETRNGLAVALPGPVLMRVNWPHRRVLLDAARDANPVFHLMEAMWMLAGRNDVAFVQQYNSNIGSYSDDGTSFNAAYGHRWCEHFGYDQLTRAAEMLNINHNDRRVVVGMWDPYKDLGGDSKDLPCNTQVMFRVINGGLHMTTTNRSNDMVWGLTGANFVHMSILHEWMAAAIGMHFTGPEGQPRGKWHHLSNNLHVYERHFGLIGDVKPDSGLSYRRYQFYNTVTDPKLFRAECLDLVNGKEVGFTDPFFIGTIEPMVAAWRAWKSGDKKAGLVNASKIQSWDWRIGTMSWFARRMQ